MKIGFCKKYEKVFSLVVLVVLLIALISAQQQITTPAGNIVEVTLENVEHKTIDGKEEYTFNENGELTVSYKDKEENVVDTITYESLGKIDNEDPKLIFDKGKLIKANFKTLNGGEYVLGNEKVSLPKGAEVRFEEGEAKITLAEEYKIKKTESFDGNVGETVFTYDYVDAKKFDYKFADNENIFLGDNIKFQNGNFFFDYKGKAQIGGVKMISENSEVRNYIDFNGEINTKYDGSYVSINDKSGVFVTGSNVDARGPKIAFEEENPFGLKLGANKHFAVQSLGNIDGAYFKITKGDSKNVIPQFEWQNQFVMNQDGGSVFYNSDTQNLYLSKKTLIEGFEVPKNSEVVVMGGAGYKTSENGREEFSSSGSYLGFADHGGIALGANPNYMKTTAFWNVGTDVALRRGFSNLWSYYNLRTEEDFERITGINVEDNIGQLKNPKNVKILTDIIAQLPKETQDNLKIIKFIPNQRGFVARAAGGWMEVTPNGFRPSVIRHEITHLRDFELGAYRGSSFARLWASVGGDNAPYLTPQATGSDPREKISTFMQQIYRSNNYWNQFLQNQKYSPTVKARLAVLFQNKYVTRDEIARILGGAGFKSDDASLNQYIREAQGRR